MGASWLIGVCISLVSSTIKYSHLQDQQKPIERRTPPWRRPRWLCGMGIFALGNAGDFVALGFAAQSLLAPLGSISLVANAIIAHYFLGETFTINDLYSTITIISGATITVIFSDHEERDYTLDELLDLYKRLIFVIYAVFLFFCIALLYSGFRILGSFHKENHHKTLVNKLLPFCTAGTGALIGSITILTAKSTSELFQTSLKGDNQFVHYYAFIIVIVFISTAIAQVYWINVGIAMFDSLYVIPAFYCVWTVFGVIGGSVYFDEFSHFGTLQFIFFPIGVFTTLLGVVLLSRRKMTVRASKWGVLRAVFKIRTDFSRREKLRPSSDQQKVDLNSGSLDQLFDATEPRNTDIELEVIDDDIDLGSRSSQD